MSCVVGPAKFRLLDAYVGWDVATQSQLTGFDDPRGVTLALLAGIDPRALLDRLPPPRLARGCGRCNWYLATSGDRGVLLVSDDCCGFSPAPPPAGCPGSFFAPIAVAARGHRVAVADSAGVIRIFGESGGRVIAVLHVDGAWRIALAPNGELWVARASDPAILRFGPGGDARGTLASLPVALFATGTIDRLAADTDGAVWAVIADATAGTTTLWRARAGESSLTPAPLADLEAAFPATGLTAASDAGFCLSQLGVDGTAEIICRDWNGACLSAPLAPPAESYPTDGELVTVALDSGIPRCRWHRVRVDADIPTGAALIISIAATERPGAPPDPSDWQSGPPGALDFLVDQPAGRWMRVRLSLHGDGTVTPVVRRVRLDFPRATSLERLPAVYGSDPEAADFSERFLALFDATIEEIDDAITRSPALLDPNGVPDALLPWLGRFFDIALDPAWSDAQRRAIIAAAPALYAARGTVGGLQKVIEMVTGSRPAIEELSQERGFGALGRDTRLRGGTRLFSQARARFRVGSSGLGQAPLRAFGDPASDPFADVAFRFRVLAPPSPFLSLPSGTERLARLVAGQKPAHTVAAVRVGGRGLVVGSWSVVGVDTALSPLPPAVLGGPRASIRLGRMGVLAPARTGRHCGFAVGETAVVGVETVLQ
jgi:phage tail-like protein